MTDNQSNTYILFQIAGSTYAVRSESVHQVEMIEQVTPLPGAPHPGVFAESFSMQFRSVVEKSTR